jgi:hypothetical protein
MNINDIPLHYSGDVIKEFILDATSKDPVAILFLDALRYDLETSVSINS